MRDQWKRGETDSKFSGRNRSRRRRKSGRGNKPDNHGEGEFRPRRSKRQRRLEELTEYETDRMLRQIEGEDSGGA